MGEFSSIVTLTLIGNSVQAKPHYRAYLIHKLPHLRVLDFQKVKKHEREEAEKLFGSPEGVALAATIAKKVDNTFVPGQDVSVGASSSSGASSASKLSPEQRAKIREAIKIAKTDEELSRLEEALRTGKMPKELV